MTAAPVAVIVVSWDRRELLLDCLESLQNQTMLPAEVIVVDNGSTDGSAEAVARRFGFDAAAPVRVIRSETNLGFAGGNNLGAAAATAPWLALLNNDAAADPRWLE
jgi:GT2 family glycosyltransferase